jgi:hypothetical protein
MRDTCSHTQHAHKHVTETPRTEAGLRGDEAVGADQLERHAIGDDGAVAVGDVGEGAYEGGR